MELKKLTESLSSDPNTPVPASPVATQPGTPIPPGQNKVPVLNILFFFLWLSGKVPAQKKFLSQKKKPCCFFWIAEKTESLLGTAEDKETTEQDSKKLSEQEVSPLFFFLPLSITLILFSFIVLSVFSWFITLQPHSSSSEGSSVKLGHLLTHLSVLYPLSSFSCCCPVWFVFPPPPSADLQCRSSTWEGSWQRRGQGQLRRENRRWAKQNRVALHKDGAICQPKRVRFEKNRAVIQSKLAEKWVVHDWCAAFFFLRLFFNWVFFFSFFFCYPQWIPAKKQGSRQKREILTLLWQNLKTRKTSQVYVLLILVQMVPCAVLGVHIYLFFYIFMFAVADDMKSDDALEGRLNGDKDSLDEMEESRKEDKNGFKAKFMFNIADGGFTGKNKALRLCFDPKWSSIDQRSDGVKGCSCWNDIFLLGTQFLTRINSIVFIFRFSMSKKGEKHQHSVEICYSVGLTHFRDSGL